ncbi:Hypothetical Protein SLY_0941 [Strawberry lethal yellows phytoplasma (CPA) str. NZSb11]|uniref:Uncharacterized protein n=1 Tax=Strawberry lethal yellows phytoplasma (CPA) str. NZSb11 TaxID=980422 RepID=R4RQR9_PHYAS|nr:Hypothetical Protein SLY_0941 [Strawberry lethal yellows phytoplasma (CPA) str. NZSb11]
MEQSIKKTKPKSSFSIIPNPNNESKNNLESDND